MGILIISGKPRKNFVLGHYKFMHKLEMAAAYVLVGYHTVGMGGPFIAHSKSHKYLSNVLFGYLKQ